MHDLEGAGNSGIIIDLLPPEEWTAEAVQASLRKQEELDNAEGWGFTDNEIVFIGKTIAHWIGQSDLAPRELFEINTDDPRDDDDSRCVADLRFPDGAESMCRHGG